jgi:hypothetical protein
MKKSDLIFILNELFDSKGKTMPDRYEESFIKTNNLIVKQSSAIAYNKHFQLLLKFFQEEIFL